VSRDDARLFVGHGKIDDALRATLRPTGAGPRPTSRRARRCARCRPAARCCSTAKRVTLGLREAVPDAVAVVEAINPRRSRRAARRRRGRVRARGDGGRRCRDVLASMPGSRRRWAASDHRAHRRRAPERRAGAPARLREPQLPVIAGFNANGAMPHYRASPSITHDLAARASGPTACC
jgi:Xaa-Pro aminopeptidase